ncbi:MAG TPA: hypothetical protein VEG39_20290 [Clostridia bacterium]|nr:hypothetical protein [Clostridia bacterium]
MKHLRYSILFIVIIITLLSGCAPRNAPQPAPAQPTPAQATPTPAMGNEPMGDMKNITSIQPMRTMPLSQS